MSKLLKINRLVGLYLIFFSPLVITLLVWSSFISTPSGVPVPHFDSRMASFAWDILGIHFMFWLVSLLYFFIMLVFHGALRDSVIAFAAGLNARDEREELIIGHASRASWLSSMALMIFLLLSSGLMIKVTRFSSDNGPSVAKGKRGSVSIGYRFTLFDPPVKNKQVTKPTGEKTVFLFTGLPFSKNMILMFLLLWQILSFKFFARKVAARC
ncbi:hypothetical protein KKF34_03980 [Myxococcota bacterium]|nr:hypothetical protein [Myxococcota bacterium]MBU1381498.1 hypothetical protein [Myxococcota bacterium]MBU1496015.1 hypothetical protein [Myxococcota bacterium]